MSKDTSKPKFPLHAAIRDPLSSEQHILNTLREVYQQDPASLAQVDDYGHTPLAVAVMAANVPAISGLVDMACVERAQGDDILGLHLSDRSQDTPASYNLRILQENPRFMIYDILKTASKELTDAFIKRRLPLCLCKKCDGGWFSPRMRFRLRETANQILKQMRTNLNKFVGGERLDGELVLTDPALPFLPVSVLQRGIYKPFYVGYLAAFQTIVDVLNKTGPESLPTVQRLRMELVDGTRHGRYDLNAVRYFAMHGGSVTYALDLTIHQAVWESPIPFGDGTFDKKWDEPLDSPLANPMSPVPNDLKKHTRGRSRPHSLKGAFKPFISGRRGSLDSRCNHDVSPKVPNMALSTQEKEKLRKWKLKEDWAASGDPGCPLDAQFVGVRYLVGLHEEARWEIALDHVDARGKRPSCELRRASSY